jgi:hypothetical protein
LEAKVVKDFDKVQFIHQVRDIMTTSVWSYHVVVLAIFQQNGMAYSVLNICFFCYFVFQIEMILQALEYEKGEFTLAFGYLHHHFPMCSSYEVWACDQTKWIIDKIQLMYQV